MRFWWVPYLGYGSSLVMCLAFLVLGGGWVLGVQAIGLAVCLEGARWQRREPTNGRTVRVQAYGLALVLFGASYAAAGAVT